MLHEHVFFYGDADRHFSCLKDAGWSLHILPRNRDARASKLAQVRLWGASELARPTFRFKPILACIPLGGDCTCQVQHFSLLGTDTRTGDQPKNGVKSDT